MAADLDTHTGGLFLVRFSPDGQRILTGCYDGFVRVFDLAGNELLALRADGEYTNAAWSPDGKRILCCTVEGNVTVWSALGPAEGHS